MAILVFSILSPFICALGKAEKFLKLLPDGEHLCALLWCKYVWKLILSRKFRGSTALVMAILAFSILSPCIRALSKAEKCFKLLPDGEHLCALLW